MLRSTLFAGSALFALIAVPVAAQTAPAQTAAAVVEADAPADIIVTAQKREQRLQDVPVAVSVVSGAQLANQGRVSIESLTSLVPSFTFLKSGTTLNQSLFLRGVGTSTFSIAGEPSVSTVVDGVVFSRSGEAFSDLFDVERIEVLRGPQGTLFGKNASAGVINVVSKKPGKDLGGFVEGGFFFANGNEYRVRGAVDVPLTQTLRSRITGFYDKYDGNIFNYAPNVNRRVNGFEHYGARGIVQADAGESVQLTFIADYHRNKDDCCAEVIGGAPLTGTGAVNTANLALIQTVLPILEGDKTRGINQNLVTRTEETGYGFSLQADIELGTQTITSITAYRNYKNTEIRDGDWLPQAYIGVQQLHDDGPQTGNTFSQELRLTSPGKQFFDYVVGAYFSRAVSERIFTRNDQVCTLKSGATLPVGVYTPCTSALANPSTFPTGTADFGSNFKNMAVFGQGTINIAPHFRIIAGARFTLDQLDVFHSRVTTPNGLFPGIRPSFDNGVYNDGLGNGTPNGVPWRGRATNQNFSGKAGVQYDVNRDMMAYATYSRGYKGPAFNVFFNQYKAGKPPFDPSLNGVDDTNIIAAETSNAYEIGLKNTLFDGRLTLNLAGFYAKYSNFQANSPDTAAGVVVTRFTNAGTVSTRGGELEFAWRPLADLAVSGGVAYTDAHVDQFNCPPGCNPANVIPSGTPLGFAPKWKGNVGADYRFRTGGAVDFSVGAQGSYQSSQLSQFSPNPIVRNAATIGGYGLVNLSAALIDNNDRYQLTFIVRNLFDQSFAAAIANGGPSGSYRYQIPRDADRYFGIIGKVNF